MQLRYRGDNSHFFKPKLNAPVYLEAKQLSEKKQEESTNQENIFNYFKNFCMLDNLKNYFKKQEELSAEKKGKKLKKDEALFEKATLLAGVAPGLIEEIAPNILKQLPSDAKNVFKQIFLNVSQFPILRPAHIFIAMAFIQNGYAASNENEYTFINVADPRAPKEIDASVCVNDNCHISYVVDSNGSVVLELAKVFGELQCYDLDDFIKKCQYVYKPQCVTEETGKKWIEDILDERNSMDSTAASILFSSASLPCYISKKTTGGRIDWTFKEDLYGIKGLFQDECSKFIEKLNKEYERCDAENQGFLCCSSECWKWCGISVAVLMGAVGVSMVSMRSSEYCNRLRSSSEERGDLDYEIGELKENKSDSPAYGVGRPS